MNDMDLTILMAKIAPVVRDFVKESQAPLLTRLEESQKRIAELESTLKSWPKREDVAVEIADLVNSAVKSIAPAQQTLALEVDATKIKAVVDEAVAGITVDFEEVGRVVDDRLAKAVDALPKAPTAAEVAALVPKAIDGKSVTLEEVRPLVDEVVAAKVAELPPAKDGKDVELEVVRAMVVEIVDAQPKAKDGESVTVDQLRPLCEELMGRGFERAFDRVMDALPLEVSAHVKAEVGALPPVPTAAEVAAEIPAPKDGKDASPEAIAAEVEKVLATWERPKDGKSVTLEEVMPALQEGLATAVAALPPAKDGVGLTGAIKDHEGGLVLTLTDGTMVKVGRVDGEPGLDGFGFDDMTEELADDGRTIIRRYSRGDQVKEFRHTFPVVLDRGVFKDGTEYVAGDGTTWGGSFWIAKTTTKDKPGTSEAWRLAVKKGRDGQDFRPAEPKDPAKVKLR